MAAAVDRKLLADVKRFRERWIGDDRFRAALAADPEAAAEGLGIEPAPLSFLWRSDAPMDRSVPEVRAHLRIEEAGRAYLEFAADDTGAIEAYRTWRARQRARSAFSQGSVVSPFALHLPFAVELTRGCSLGCWFCGLSASRLESVLPTDLAAWTEMLHTLRDLFGASAARGFLFWATDPLDHPDYEAYAQTFGHVLGRFPVTTTAAAIADIDRTRRLMSLSRNGNSPSLRFSVVSRRGLVRIHEIFSAEELADVDLVLVNRESVLALAEAGHVRAKAERWPERVAFERDKFERWHTGRRFAGSGGIWAHRTIACVSGFLIEPVIGRIRLISPEPSSRRWPDGYAVFGEERFANPEEFEGALGRLVARHMGPGLPDRLALQRGVSVKAESRTLVSAEGGGHRIALMSRRRDLRYLTALAQAFRGGAPVEDTLRRIARRFDIAPRVVRRHTADLWQQGVLIESVFAFAEDREAYSVPA